MVRCDGLLYDLLWGVPLSVLKSDKIWLPWFLIYLRICEMFNVKDERDRNFGVDFLLLFCHYYLKCTDSPNIFNYRHQTPAISNQALQFSWDGELFASWTDIFAKKSHFWQHPCRQMVQSENFCTMELSEVPNFYSLGIVFMVVKALQTTLSSVSLMDKMLTLDWSHSLMSLLYLNPLNYKINK